MISWKFSNSCWDESNWTNPSVPGSPLRQQKRKQIDTGSINKKSPLWFQFDWSHRCLCWNWNHSIQLARAWRCNCRGCWWRTRCTWNSCRRIQKAYWAARRSHSLVQLPYDRMTFDLQLSCVQIHISWYLETGIAEASGEAELTVSDSSPSHWQCSGQNLGDPRFLGQVGRYPINVAQHCWAWSGLGQQRRPDEDLIPARHRRKRDGDANLDECVRCRSNPSSKKEGEKKTTQFEDKYWIKNDDWKSFVTPVEGKIEQVAIAVPNEAMTAILQNCDANEQTH